MVENFLKQYAMMIADYPNSVRTEKNVSEEFTEIIIYADKADTGKLIGKDGKMINAIKNIEVFNRKTCHEYAQETFNHLVMSKKYLQYYDMVLNGQNLHDKEPSVNEYLPTDFYLTD